MSSHPYRAIFRDAQAQRYRVVVKCETCGDELPATARRNRRYCDARCRRRAYEERQAPARPELALVVPVAAAAKTNWRASAWLLERRYPERWAAPPRRADDEAPPAVDANDPFAEIDMLAAKRRARRDGE
jgi:hypothetical protein